MTVDVYVESTEKRQGLSDFEARQEKKGFWRNAVKRKVLLRGVAIKP